MGNHHVGRAMAAGARGFWMGNGDAPVTAERALEVLDAIAEDFRGSDAEWDDELSGETPLARLVIAAFEATDEETAALRGEAGDDDDEADAAWGRWHDGPLRRFSERYGFC